MRLLEEKGILERRDFGGGRARYEPTEHGHHYHLIDIETGKVIEFEDAEHERSDAGDRGPPRLRPRLPGWSCSAGGASRAEAPTARGRHESELANRDRHGGASRTRPTSKAGPPVTMQEPIGATERRAGFGELRAGNLGVRIADQAERRSTQCRRCAIAYSIEEMGANPDPAAAAASATATRSKRWPTICWWSITRSGRGRRAWSAPTG